MITFAQPSLTAQGCLVSIALAAIIAAVRGTSWGNRIGLGLEEPPGTRHKLVLLAGASHGYRTRLPPWILRVRVRAVGDAACPWAALGLAAFDVARDSPRCRATFGMRVASAGAYAIEAHASGHAVAAWHSAVPVAITDVLCAGADDYNADHATKEHLHHPGC